MFINIYPPLHTYIKNVLLESLSLLTANKLKRFEIRIHKGDKVLESFIVEINSESVNANLNELEETFKNCVHSLENRCKLFKKASKDCRFRIFLHSDSYQDYASDSRSLVRESDNFYGLLKLTFNFYLTGLPLDRRQQGSFEHRKRNRTDRHGVEIKSLSVLCRTISLKVLNKNLL